MSARLSPGPPPAPPVAPAQTFEAARVASLVETVLGRQVIEALFVPKGFANENWRVRTSEGDVLVKIGLAGASAAKWRASARALDLARTARVHGPQLLHSESSCAALDGRVLRIQRWVDGVSPDTLDGAPAARFWTALGRAVRALHGVAFERFSSRLDASAPDFSTWSAYLAYRIPQIEARCAQASVLSAAERAEVWERVLDDARRIDGLVRPAFVHRDLHPDNLLATPDGALAGLLDFDMVEPWDPVGDWFKLEHWCFAGQPARRSAFEAGYGVPAERHAAFEARRVIIDIVEGLNMAAAEGSTEGAGVRAWSLAIVKGALAA